MNPVHYEYVPLDKAAREIRLLILLPATFDSPVESLLISTPFTEDDAPQYEALSYAWGSTDDPIDISIRTTDILEARSLLPGSFNSLYDKTSDRKRHVSVGKQKLARPFKKLYQKLERLSLVGTSSSSPGFGTLSVTQNLARALPYLRYSDKPRVLWIDAICVNQKDLIERSAQVQRMADVYTQAARVVVWLGEESHNSRFAIETLKMINTKVNFDFISHRILLASNDPADAHWNDHNSAPPFNTETMVSLNDLFHRSWFERLWILQEIQFANQSSILMCGEDVLQWLDFRVAVWSIYTKPRTVLLQNEQEDHNRILEHLSKLCLDCQNSNFSTLQEVTQQSKCADPRDRVFALLSLLHKDYRHGIRPDYTKTIEQVYQETTVQIFKNEGSLNLLSSCGLHSQQVGMPSWVIDPSTRRNPETLRAPPVVHSSLDRILESGKTLQTQGLMITTLQTLWPTLPHVNNHVDEIAAETLRLASNFDLARPYHYGGNNSEALFRTLIVNHFAETFYPPIANFPSVVICPDFFETVSGALESRDPSHLKKFQNYMREASSTLSNRAIFASKEGYIGLCPSSSQQGDYVVLLVGCTNPLILRAQINGTYLLVGEAYCHGIMDGEPFLGPLPLDIGCVWSGDSDNAAHWKAFLNRETEVVQFEDPRLGALPPDWSRMDNRRFFNSRTKETRWSEDYDPRTTPEELEKRGVKLQDFHLA